MAKQTSMVAGSLAAVAKKNGNSLAAGFLSVKVLVMMDVSGSMAAVVPGCEKRRYDIACDQLQQLQAANPGDVGVCTFSHKAEFCPGGMPSGIQTTTDMAAALRMLKMADGCGIRMILISDGEPDSEADTLKIAKTFTSKIDTIYVGSEDGPGRQFLRSLSAATGGISITNATRDLNKLSDNITRLIGA